MLQNVYEINFFKNFLLILYVCLSPVGIQIFKHDMDSKKDRNDLN